MCKLKESRDKLITKPKDPTKSNNKFLAWYKDKELAELWDFENDKMPARDIVLYTKWESTGDIGITDPVEPYEPSITPEKEEELVIIYDEDLPMGQIILDNGKKYNFKQEDDGKYLIIDENETPLGYVDKLEDLSKDSLEKMESKIIINPKTNNKDNNNLLFIIISIILISVLVNKKYFKEII